MNNAIRISANADNIALPVLWLLTAHQFLLVFLTPWPRPDTRSLGFSATAPSSPCRLTLDGQGPSEIPKAYTPNGFSTMPMPILQECRQPIAADPEQTYGWLNQGSLGTSKESNNAETEWSSQRRADSAFDGTLKRQRHTNLLHESCEWSMSIQGRIIRLFNLFDSKPAS